MAHHKNFINRCLKYQYILPFPYLFVNKNIIVFCNVFYILSTYSIMILPYIFKNKIPKRYNYLKSFNKIMK